MAHVKPIRWAWLLSALWLAQQTTAKAVPDSYGLGDGHDGAFIALTGSTNVNSYSTLTAEAAAYSNTIQVTTPGAFTSGDLILIWQVKDGSYTAGAAKNVSVTTSGPGRYEVVRVTAISGNTLTLEKAITRNYHVNGGQVVRVPEYTTVTVPAGRAISAQAWNGSTGGIVAFLATGGVTLNGSIVADGAGFRGGSVSNNQCTGACNCSTVDASFDAPCTEGLGRHGESLDTGLIGSCGTGNKANGAGGGGLVNAGGAGGGNGGFGGAGGSTTCSTQRAGGYAGTRAVGSLADSLTLGGGGGGGQEDNAAGGSGGAGGGVIWVRADGISGTGTLRASGSSGTTALLDGGGGGGAGGSIFVRVSGVADCTALRAQGGSGSGASTRGGGGGGGGGRVWLDAPGGGSCSVSLIGGPEAPNSSYPTNWSGNGSAGVNEPCDSDFDTCSECGGATPSNDGTDTDGDGICNAGDDDDDNDGTPDQLDSALANPCVPSTTPPTCSTGDADGDGIPNGVECPNPLSCLNTDGTDLPDYLDTDSDNDGIPDSAECTQSPCENSDNDALPDYRDPDSDNDGDGDGSDCSRFDPHISHLATEIVDDGIDENCDGKELCFDDRDDDGYLDGSGATLLSDDLDCNDPHEGKRTDPTTDCNDNNPAVHPGATEIVGDGIDENCDGQEICYADHDADGYLDTSGALRISNDSDCSDPGEGLATEPTTDCNDYNASIHPGATEIIGDGIDENCDGQELCFYDHDNDGFLDTSGDFIVSADSDCQDPFEGTLSDPTTDCNDADPNTHPGAVEICDLIDQNCNGSIVDSFPDMDGDGIPDCVDPDRDGDGDPDTTDCAPADPAISHSASDANCDHVDNNCNGKIDENGDPHDLACGDKDADGDGIANDVECVDSSVCPDSDADGTPNWQDTDSDGDGLSDGAECPNAKACTDTDTDGLPDYVEHATRDTEGDGLPDQKDSDADGDTIKDGDECKPSGCPDTDGDTIPDELDADDLGPGAGDSDGDGLNDDVECSKFPCEDTDGDHVPDYGDTDSDADGTLDSFDPAPRDPCIPKPVKPDCPRHDAGVPDAGEPDASLGDAGMDGGATDAGVADGGVQLDAGRLSDASPAQDASGTHSGTGDQLVGAVGGGACSARAGGSSPDAALTLLGLGWVLSTRRRRRSAAPKQGARAAS